jgi:hypothetical protein
VLPAGADYGFRPGKFCNFDPDAYIRSGDAWSGASISDSTGPEVAMAICQTALSNA